MKYNYEHIAGCLLGGAVGDALGAPVEFMSIGEIRRKFGENGIQNYSPAYGRLGAITDDTQMTLFTLEGILRTIMRGYHKGITSHIDMVKLAYLRWLGTQGELREDIEHDIYSGWLYQQKDLHSRRAPGNSCLSALRSIQFKADSDGRGTIEKPINDSKGCGGVMRMAPVGFFGQNDSFRIGCELAALTHGHPSGYLAAGFLAQVIDGIMKCHGLSESIERAKWVLQTWPKHSECLRAVNKALALAESADPTPENIERLGGGWVAEEALAISLFCALTAPNFHRGIAAAVNHSGDSDSTGAITGNILGALWGVSAVPEDLRKDLELRDVIEEMAEDVVRLQFSSQEDGSSWYHSDCYWNKYPGW